jgi:hypothetical protein
MTDRRLGVDHEAEVLALVIVRRQRRAGGVECGRDGEPADTTGRLSQGSTEG